MASENGKKVSGRSRSELVWGVEMSSEQAVEFWCPNQPGLKHVLMAELHGLGVRKLLHLPAVWLRAFLQCRDQVALKALQTRALQNRLAELSAREQSVLSVRSGLHYWRTHGSGSSQAQPTEEVTGGRRRVNLLAILTAVNSLDSKWPYNHSWCVSLSTAHEATRFPTYAQLMASLDDESSRKVGSGLCRRTASVLLQCSHVEPVGDDAHTSKLLKLKGNSTLNALIADCRARGMKLGTDATVSRAIAAFVYVHQGAAAHKSKNALRRSATAVKRRQAARAKRDAARGQPGGKS